MHIGHILRYFLPSLVGNNRSGSQIYDFDDESGRPHLDRSNLGSGNRQCDHIGSLVLRSTVYVYPLKFNLGSVHFSSVALSTHFNIQDKYVIKNIAFIVKNIGPRCFDGRCPSPTDETKRG